MKKSGHGIAVYMKRAAAVTVTAAAVLAIASAAVEQMPQLLHKTASLSAALAMPEAAVQRLRERFADDIDIEPEEDTAEPRVSIQPQPPEPLPPTVEAVLPKEEKERNIKTQRQEQPDKKPKEDALPEIPEENRGKVLTEDLSDSDGKIAIKIDNFRLRNYTSVSAEELKEITSKPSPIVIEDTAEPQVLIYHTHATESYCPYDNGYYDTRYNWRSTDNNNNMVAVGAVMAETLRQNGIAVIQDTQQHDYPSYNGSYANSYRSAKDNLESYPTVKVMLDIHRDAIERESGVIVKPTAEYGGQSYAQLMLVANCDDGSGLLPNWRENLRFAADFSRELEQIIPNITRPILFSHRKYNQQLSNGALLLEFGSHANTIEEAKRTAQVAGQALANVLKRKETDQNGAKE